MTETLSIQTWALIGAIIFLIIMIGFAVSKTFSDEAVFYSSYFDLFLSFVPVIAVFMGWYYISRYFSEEGLSTVFNWYFDEGDLRRGLVVVSAFGALIYNYFRAFQYNSHSKFLAFCIGTGRVTFGYLLPVIVVLGLFCALGGGERRKGESLRDYKERRAAEAAASAAVLASLGTLFTKLIRSPELVRSNIHFKNKCYDDYAYENQRRDSYINYTQEAEVEKEFDPYEVLGIIPEASKEDVERAYKKMSTLYHPDKVATLGEDLKKMAEKKMQDINRARAELHEFF